DLCYFGAAADRGVEQSPAQIDSVNERVQPDGRAFPIVREKRQPRTGLNLGEGYVQLSEVELPGGIAGQPCLPPLTVRGIEIVTVDEGARNEGVDVIISPKLVVQRCWAAEQLNSRRIRSGVSIGLIPHAAEDGAGKDVPGGSLIYFLQQCADAFAYRRRYVVRLHGVLQIDPCHLVSAHPHVEGSELQTDAWQIRIVDQHSLERRNRRIMFAEPGSEC